jgi:hypothetical protein
MNDMLRAHGKFDVVAGVFSFYSELSVKNANISGWVKPLFKDVQAYDATQDRDKSGVKKLYEVVTGVAKVMKNVPRKEVATQDRHLWTARHSPDQYGPGDHQAHPERVHQGDPSGV